MYNNMYLLLYTQTQIFNIVI